MQKVSSVKTASARKYGSPLLVLLAALLIVVFVWLAFPSQAAILRVNGHIYNLDVVTTVAAQEKGLGGLTSLPTDDGMLFSFSNEAVRCFWMKDTEFPLDMIWLNSSKQVVHIEANASPKTYPKTFCPSQPAQYVIELNAGQAHTAGISTGQTLKF